MREAIENAALAPLAAHQISATKTWDWTSYRRGWLLW